MYGDLETVLVLVQQALDLEEVFLIEGVERVLDVVPHFGVDLPAAVAQSQRQIRLACLLGLNLLGNHNKAGDNDLVLEAGTVGKKKFFHGYPIERDFLMPRKPSVRPAYLKTRLIFSSFSESSRWFLWLLWFQ